MSNVAALLQLLSGQEPVSSSVIQSRLNLSQATVSRLIRRAGADIIRIGRGRSTRYAAASNVFDASLELPIFRVDERGQVERLVNLHRASNGQYVVLNGSPEHWLQGEHAGLYDSMPYFLYDLRLRGFLGRQLARKLGPSMGFPIDPRQWSDDQIGQYFLRHGCDLPGNLIIGEQAVDLFLAKDFGAIDDRACAYPELVRRVERADVPGSSAAGEQPKFAVHIKQAGHVVTKYGPHSTNPVSQRWQDLLIAEYHALRALRQFEIQTVDAELFQFDGRYYLESHRFDRQEERGRLAAISLEMIDAEFAGEGYSWTRVAQALRRQNLISQQDLDKLRWAEAFGEWIGNVDMHLGNISMRPRGGGFSLLPIYDMLPMAFAPRRGELPHTELRPPVRDVAHAEIWHASREAAIGYWESLAAEPRLSDSFRQIAADAAKQGYRRAYGKIA